MREGRGKGRQEGTGLLFKRARCMTSMHHAQWKGCGPHKARKRGGYPRALSATLGAPGKGGLAPEAGEGNAGGGGTCALGDPRGLPHSEFPGALHPTDKLTGSKKATTGRGGRSPPSRTVSGVGRRSSRASLTCYAGQFEGV